MRLQNPAEKTLELEHLLPGRLDFDVLMGPEDGGRIEGNLGQLGQAPKEYDRSHPPIGHVRGRIRRISH